MPSLPVIKQVLQELLSGKNAYRVPEPTLVMDDPAQVASFHEAGLENGVMAPVYLFHAAQVCEVVRPGDTVVDLGCGPANQLGIIAALNPDVHFIGVDLSREMLDLAERNLNARGIRNVELREGDITALTDFPDHSVDAVFSTVVLHHLPDEPALFRCFSEVARVLKSDAGLYLVDFGHLKTVSAINYFAYQYADRQPELFTVDYLNSLHAAFELETWRSGHRSHLATIGRIHATFPVPFMVAIKSPSRRVLPGALLTELRQRRGSLPPHHQTDLKDLITFFRLGGLASPSL